MEKLLDCLAFGRNAKSYNEDVRSFCLTLHYYSPRAYNYVRGKFNNNLPSISAMRNWYASINASPGFTTEAFESLRKMTNKHMEKTGSKLLVNVMADDMAIRRHAQWNPATMKFDGFIDLGRIPEHQDTLPLAKEALVYLVSGVDNDFKIPVAYFLSNGLNGEERAAITYDVLSRLSDIGIEVVALIFDGLRANRTMCTALGAKFDEDKRYIYNQENHKIYILLDAAHLIKLARNCIGSKNLIDSESGVIEWKYFQLLYDMQKSLPWNLGNKLNKAHMQWEKRKMCVKLAVETLSNSVADSMEFMENECNLFKDVGPTAKYIRFVNDIFDIMNSTKKEGVNGFKRALSKETADDFFQRFDEAMYYFKELKVDGEEKSILQSNCGTAFFGFCNNMVNFKSIFEDYIITGKIDVLITHRFSQDLLESFFGSIRSMGGMCKYVCNFTYSSYC